MKEQGEKTHKIVGLRLTIEEWARVHAMAEADGKKPDSSIARRLFDDHFEKLEAAFWAGKKKHDHKK